MNSLDLAIIAITELLKVAGTIADAAGIPREALRLEAWEETVARIKKEQGGTT
jgi:hypothetical protein